jgi:hypothetical protein
MGNNKKNRKKVKSPKKDLLNRLGDKSFDKYLREAQGSVDDSPVETANVAERINSATSLVFASMVVGPCAALFASPKFGITLEEKGPLLLVVALLSVVVLMMAYEANVEHALNNKKKVSTPELQHYAIYFVNLCFLLMFLFVGFFVIPTIGGLVPISTEVTYFVTVGGNAILVYLWQKGIILKGI